MGVSLVGSIISLAIVGVFIFLIFWVCRELILWYWKITEAVGLLAEIRNDLKTIRLSLDSDTKTRLQGPPSGVVYSNSRMKLPDAVMPVFKD